MPSAYEWKLVHRGSILPAGAVSIGPPSPTGESFYVARNSAGECGRLRARDYKVWSISCHQSGEVQEGEVFVVNGSLAAQWKAVRRGDRLPARTVWVGRTQEQGDIFVGRTVDGDCGKLSLKNGRVYGIYCSGSRSSVQEGDALQINPGAAAPLDEHGYECLLAQRDDLQMAIFIERTLFKQGRRIANQTQFRAFVRLCTSETCAVRSYAPLCDELRTVPWALDIRESDKDPDGSLNDSAPRPIESWLDAWLTRPPFHGLQSGSRSSIDLRVWVGTWNLQATEPFASPEVRSRGPQLLQQHFVPSGYDLYLLGVQECASEELFETMESALRHEGVRRVNFEMNDGAFLRNSRRTSAAAPRVVGHGDGSLLSKKFTGLAVFASARLVARGIRITSFGSRSLDRLSSKGAAVVALVLDSGSKTPVTLSFASCHLQAGTRGVSTETRRMQYRELTNALSAIVCAPGLEMMTQFHHVVWVGDMNYRCVNGTDEKFSPMRPEAVLDALEAGQTRRLFKEHDGLNWKRYQEEVFYDYCEPEPYFKNFLPTYKLVEERQEPNVSEKGWARKHYRTLYKEPFYKGGQTKERTPGFCDRILFHSQADMRQNFQPEAVQVCEEDELAAAEGHERCHNYRSIQGGEGFVSSDHAPVFATFRLRLPGDPRIDEAPPSPGDRSVPRLSRWLLEETSAHQRLGALSVASDDSEKSEETKSFPTEDIAPEPPAIPSDATHTEAHLTRRAEDDESAQSPYRSEETRSEEGMPPTSPGRLAISRASSGDADSQACAGSPLFNHSASMESPRCARRWQRASRLTSHRLSAPANFVLPFERSLSNPPPKAADTGADQTVMKTASRRSAASCHPEFRMSASRSAGTIHREPERLAAMGLSHSGIAALPNCPASLTISGLYITWEHGPTLQPAGCEVVFPAPFEAKPTRSGLPCVSLLPTSSWVWQQASPSAMAAGALRAVVPPALTTITDTAADRQECADWPTLALLWWGVGGAAALMRLHLLLCLLGPDEQASPSGRSSSRADTPGMRPNILGQISVALGPVLQDAIPFRRKRASGSGASPSSDPEALRAHVRQPLVHQGSPDFNRDSEGNLRRKYVEFDLLVQFQGDADEG